MIKFFLCFVIVDANESGYVIAGLLRCMCIYFPSKTTMSGINVAMAGDQILKMCFRELQNVSHPGLLFCNY